MRKTDLLVDIIRKSHFHLDIQLFSSKTTFQQAKYTKINLIHYMQAIFSKSKPQGKEPFNNAPFHIKHPFQLALDHILKQILKNTSISLQIHYLISKFKKTFNM